MKDYKKRTPYDKYKHYLVREFDMSLTKGQRNYAGFKANDYLKKQAYKDYGKNKDIISKNSDVVYAGSATSVK